MRRKQILREVRRRFQCRRSGRCCRVPGFVFLTSKDLSGLADHLSMTPDAFMETWGERIPEGRVLKRRGDDACIFLTEEGCRVHDAKPVQCREFPVRWHDGAAYDYCEGIRAIGAKGKRG